MKISTLKIICTVATVLGAVIGLGGSLAADAKQEMLIEEKIDKKLADRYEENEEES